MSLINLPPEVEPAVDAKGRLTPAWRVALEEARGPAASVSAYAAPAASATYSQAQVQALMAQVAALTAAVNALGSAD